MLWLIEYKDNSEIQHTFSLDLYLSKPREYMAPTEERANRLLKDEIVSVDAKNYITYYLIHLEILFDIYMLYTLNCIIYYITF